LSNPYDRAYELAKAIKNSDEWKDFSHWQKVISQTPDELSLLDEFRKKQMEVQMKQMQGGQAAPEELEQLNQTFGRLQGNPSIQKMMEAEQRLTRLMGDINQIIMEPMKEWFDSEQGDRK
jgi:cell fate (sporulation/competence/biofilm development) regulator YlbF (YheA/YmcA/DUF963 family)